MTKGSCWFALLLLLSLLAGCRSERVAFQFRPPPADTVLPKAKPSRPGETVVANQVAPTPKRQRAGAAMRPRPTITPLLLKKDRQWRPVSATQEVSCFRPSQLLRKARHPSVRHVRSDGAEKVAFIFGGVCVVGGVVCLLAALFSLSGVLALVGLVVLLLGLFLVAKVIGGGYGVYR